MTRWTDHVKQYAKENNISYGCALSDPKMKEKYYIKYPKTTKNNEKNKEEVKKDIINWLDNHI